MMQVQYVTNEQGQQVGVLLNMNDYRRLIGAKSAESKSLSELSEGELNALAQQKQGGLTSAEEAPISRPP